MAKKAQNWTPPVEFHFRVDFQREHTHFQGSFMEISGLDIQLETKSDKTFNFNIVGVVKGITHGDITLKRPIYPLSDNLSQWLNKCFSLQDDKNGNIEAYNLVIKLLDGEGKPVEGWMCSYAYPVKWSFSTLNAEHSGLAFETIVMAYSRLKRLNIEY